MPEKNLTIDSLGDLDDGVVREIINAAIAECLEDTDNRPMLDKPRKVQITVNFSPVIGKHGGLKGVDTAVEVKKTVPPRKANTDFCPTSIHGDDVRAYLPNERQDTMFGPAESRSTEEVS